MEGIIDFVELCVINSIGATHFQILVASTLTIQQFVHFLKERWMRGGHVLWSKVHFEEKWMLKLMGEGILLFFFPFKANLYIKHLMLQGCKDFFWGEFSDLLSTQHPSFSPPHPVLYTLLNFPIRYDNFSYKDIFMVKANFF